MAKALLLVYTQPASAEDEAEYNDWYDTVHLQDLVSVPGIVSAHRYKLSDHQMGAGPPEEQPPYLAVYEIEADDIEGVLKSMREQAPKWVITKTLGSSTQTGLFEQITAPVTA